MSIPNNTKTLVILLAIAACALVTTTYTAITVNQNINSSGTITTSPNIAVYSDSACTIPLTTVNWGSINTGGSATQTIYVKNTGTGSMLLSMAATSWNPSGAGTYISISWNKESSTLNAGQSTAATLTLNASPTTTGITTFSNTITISGVG